MSSPSTERRNTLEATFSAGTRVWVPDPAKGWLSAVVKSVRGTAITVKLDTSGDVVRLSSALIYSRRKKIYFPPTSISCMHGFALACCPSCFDTCDPALSQQSMLIHRDHTPAVFNTHT